jgi:hypothetical protein
MDFGLRIRKQADLVLWRAELPARANDLYADLLGCQPHDFALELVTHFWRDDIIGDVVAECGDRVGCRIGNANIDELEGFQPSDLLFRRLL